MSHLPIPADRAKIEAFCVRWKIVEFGFYGSVLSDRFGAESDVDVLVEFDSDAGWSLMDHVRMEDELAEILGREVDMAVRSAIEADPNWIRRKEILASAETYLVTR